RKTKSLAGRMWNPLKTARGSVTSFQSSAARTTKQEGRSFPSDKSLGYFRSSAARTRFTRSFLVVLVLCLGTSKVSAQEPAPSPAPAQQALKIPTVGVDYRANGNRPLPSLNRVGVDINDQKPLSLRDAMLMAL